MTAQRIIKFGIIGCGLMGREFASAAARWIHLRDIDVRPQIVAVCDANSDAMTWFADALPGARTFTDYHDLLAESDVEAVYCAVPHNLHQQFYVDILRAGKHLLGEKPFGMDAAQNREIMAVLAENPKLLVRCSSEMPFFPGAQKVIALAESGEMGDILEVEAGFLHSSDIDRQKPINWKRMADINGDYG